MIALELDPEIYAKVILWLTDNFIENRNIAGEAYINKMCKSISSLIKNKSELSDKIKIVAKAINFIVFNKHEDGIRNFATKNELNEIISIENAVGAIIDGEFVHSFEELRMYLGKEWNFPVRLLKFKTSPFSIIRSNFRSRNTSIAFLDLVLILFEE